MTRAPKPLPPPTDQERAVAADAARTLREALADRSTMGERGVVHLDLARPRRGVWLTTWANLPGFFHEGRTSSHACQPEWTYTQREVVAEIIPTLRRWPSAACGRLRRRG